MTESGILIVDKPAGLTSHDVVARARKILNIRKIGHAGTLDPEATGVLILCIGKATRLSEYLTGMDKEYEAVMRLGEVTSTQDASGAVLARREWQSVTPALLNGCFAHFTGEITQIPSSYSAIKIQGVPSYRLARKGKEVAVPERKVRVDRIELTAVRESDISFRVSCSKGTYIRTLCHDMGAYLGAGAHLYSLRRIRSGNFRLQDAISMEALVQAAASNRIGSIIRGMEEVMNDYPSLEIDEEREKRILHGVPVSLKCGEGSLLESGEVVCLKGPGGNLVALGTFEGGESKRVKIDKVLVEQ